jgi:hypothetical protein
MQIEMSRHMTKKKLKQGIGSAISIETPPVGFFLKFSNV